ncbi:DUF881 domain-containing protein [Tomitella biformata]|uniref:DUF881 domain-containing protein n=1 Tax=Tomitella biformata TaxID=630403 RepID=UPI0006888C52|nr:DUF881 domain-containing protein [Tomitella biformata]
MPEPAGAPGPGKTKPRKSRPAVSVILVALLCMLLGIGIVTQVRDTKSGDGLDSARPSDLLALLDSLHQREAALRQEITALEHSLDSMQSDGNSSEAALDEARARLSSLQIQVGSAPATGPGLIVMIADPRGGVDADVLLDQLQELRAAGAEAVQISGGRADQNVRIGVDSWITGGAGAIKIDGVEVSAPFTVTAIGDPPTLSAALNIPGGVIDTVRRVGGEVTVDPRDSVEISAVRDPIAPRKGTPGD